MAEQNSCATSNSLFSDRASGNTTAYADKVCTMDSTRTEVSCVKSGENSNDTSDDKMEEWNKERNSGWCDDEEAEERYSGRDAKMAEVPLSSSRS